MAMLATFDYLRKYSTSFDSNVRQATMQLQQWLLNGKSSHLIVDLYRTLPQVKHRKWDATFYFLARDLLFLNFLELHWRMLMPATFENLQFYFNLFAYTLLSPTQ